MNRRHRYQFRLNAVAIDSMFRFHPVLHGAARAEIAARRRIGRARHLALERRGQALSSTFRVGHGHSGKKRLCVRMTQAVGQLCARCDSDHLAQATMAVLRWWVALMRDRRSPTRFSSNGSKGSLEASPSEVGAKVSQLDCRPELEKCRCRRELLVGFRRSVPRFPP